MTSLIPDENERVLSAKETAEIFGVPENTVRFWADTGRLKSFKTAGGHRRFRESDVLKLKSERLSVKQVTQILGVSSQTVYRRIYSGSIPAHRPGPKLWYVLKADLDVYVENNQEES